MGDALCGIAHRFATFNHADHKRRPNQEALKAVKGDGQSVEKIDVDLAFLFQTRPGPLETQVGRDENETCYGQWWQGQGAGEQCHSQGTDRQDDPRRHEAVLLLLVWPGADWLCGAGSSAIHRDR